MAFYKTEDGQHGASIMQNGKGGDFMAFAAQSNGNNGFEYWYTVGTGYKTEATATRYAKRSLAKMGYTLIAE